MKVTEQAILNELRDAGLTEVLTHFTQLELQLQVALQVGSSNPQLSRLNFLG